MGNVQMAYDVLDAIYVQGVEFVGDIFPPFNYVALFNASGEVAEAGYARIPETNWNIASVGGVMQASNVDTIQWTVPVGEDWGQIVSVKLFAQGGSQALAAAPFSHDMSTPGNTLTIAPGNLTFYWD